MAPVLKVPPDIEQIIKDFDRRGNCFDQHDVQQALSEGRKKLVDIDEEHKKGAWADILAFALTNSRSGENPWALVRLDQVRQRTARLSTSLTLMGLILRPSRS